MEFKDSLKPPLAPLVPRFSKSIYNFLRVISPLYMRFVMRLRRIRSVHIERILSAYHRFQSGGIRLIIAFRHPTLNEPSLMFLYIANRLRKAARRQGKRLARFPHATFVYDRGVPLWLGAYGNWLLPGVGGISLYRGKVDPAGLRAIRAAMLDGAHPLCMAPEGANIYQTDIVGKLNPGVAHFGFWCAEDLAKAGRTEEVIILPVSFTYHYRDPRQRWFRSLLGRMETECFTGEKPFTGKTIAKGEAVRRITRLRERLITDSEEFYARFYRRRPPAHNENRSLQERIDALADTALRTAEEYFGITSAGDVVDRQHAAEQAAWDRIYRHDIPAPDALPPYRKALADRIAAEARLRMQHIQLADVLMYVRDDYLNETSTWDMCIESLSLCDGIMARLKGGNVGNHKPKPLADVDVIFGEPLSVNERMDAYRSDRKRTVTAFMDDLNRSYLRLIGEHHAAGDNG